MQFNVNRVGSLRVKRLIMAGWILSLASLACTLGTLATSDPTFIPPNGYNYTETPPPAFASINPLPTANPENPSEDPIDPVAPTAQPTPSPTPEDVLINTAPFLYYTQAGDTLPVVAVRFGVDASAITSPDPIPETSLLNPNQLLVIPRRLANTTSSQHIMPDSEIVFSPSAADFDINAFIEEAGGSMHAYRDYLGTTGWTRAGDVIYRVAIENSINPRLLLALLEYQGGMVYGEPKFPQAWDYPIGRIAPRDKGLYNQLAWAVNQLSIGYYGWREGRLTEIRFSDGVTARMAPDLNAGTAAIQYFFAQLYDSQEWLQALDSEAGFPALHARMFGNPWMRALAVEPLYPPDLVQPRLILPFMLNQIWGFTGGPHGAWERDGAWAAIDFGPGALISGCNLSSDVWTVAAASGQVVRTGKGIVVIDLDGDGLEQTGWVLGYLHVATKDMIKEGTWVEAGDRIGHPSCEGGLSTGDHIHLTRKYNGEWIVADGPLPFVLSGWRVHAGEKPYEGYLTRDGETIPASTLGIYASRIIRRADDP
ncbi:MAG TPA: M23 family metallopeptidase [Anaerolineales bacterium]|jgi:murein DD-endopeptidase MepM/ murein hydrolase activator NlpD